jgi:hypothetical protein
MDVCDQTNVECERQCLFLLLNCSQHQLNDLVDHRILLWWKFSKSQIFKFTNFQFNRRI